MSFRDALKNVMKSGKYGKRAAAAVIPASKKRNPKLRRVR